VRLNIPVSEVTSSAVLSKMRWRILLPFMLLIIFSSLDRVNISIAALRMNGDLGLSPERYGFAASIFFFGYVLFQFPSAALHKRIGTRAWLVTIILFWGVCASAMAFVTSATSLYILRFLLGVGEAGLTPGIVLYCTTWMPQRFRAGAIAVTLLAIPISVIFGAPLSGWLMSHSNPAGFGNPASMAGWRWMFLIEGGATLLLAALAYVLFAATPRDAHWLNAEEKQWLAAELAREQPDDAPAIRTPVMTLLANGRLWVVAAVWFALLLGSNGIIFWLPQVIKHLSHATDMQTGVLSAVPWVGVAIGMAANARHSDQRQERYAHVSLAAMLGAAALIAAMLLGNSALALGGLFLAGLGIGGAQGVFWAIPPQVISKTEAAYGITFINLIGNTASLVGPPLIGLVKAHTGSFNGPIYIMAGALCAGALLLHAIRPKP
jgi:ACS family tartrate transporter-like MFS transporter